MKSFRTIGIILAALAFIALVLSLACDKKGDKGGKTDKVAGADLYAVTRHSSDAGWKYLYWKNGESVKPFSTEGYSLVNRCEAGGAVYELDGEMADDIPFVKKNGKRLHYLTDDHQINADYLLVFGEDVYVGGSESPGDMSVGRVWKNGKRLHVLGVGGVSSLLFSGGDLYIGGNQIEVVDDDGNGPMTAVVWKNGKVHQKLSGTNVNSLFVSGGDVYAAGGTQVQKEYSVATVWKNGKVLQTLTDGSVYSRVLSLCVSGGDVYAGGTKDGGNDIGYPTIWKNGKEQTLGNAGGEVIVLFAKEAGDAPPAAKADKGTEEPPPGDVYAVTRHGNYWGWKYSYWKNGRSVEPFSTDGHSLGQRSDAGGDVYEVGLEDGSLLIVKNGGTHYVLTPPAEDGDLAAAYSLCVSGGDVYAGGYQVNSDNTRVATVWKNGKPHQSLTDGNNAAEANTLIVSGGDVYAGGYESISGTWRATVWKNGKNHSRLTNQSHYAVVHSLCLSGSDLYAGGHEGPNAMVWKNGRVHQSLNDGSMWASVHSLCVAGGDVYAGGREENQDGLGIPTIWKNGKPLHKLGGVEGDVVLVFLK